MKINLVSIGTFVLLLCSSAFISADVISESNAPAIGSVDSLISNGGFEDGNIQTGLPDNWNTSAFELTSVFTWDSSLAHSGSKSVRIDSSTPNDARWVTSAPISLSPNTLYRLSGWIKTDQVDPSIPEGASLSLLDTSFNVWTSTIGITGTQDWSFNTVIFNSGEDTQAVIGARLGHFGATTTGTAWFDDLRLTPVQPVTPHPGWKILVLIYSKTDFTYTDSAGVQHHYVATMSQDEMDQAAQNATRFVKEDIPALTSGNMIPQITIRYPENPVTRLASFAEGAWSPSPDTVADRDPSYDSVIVIWDPRAVDQNTGESRWIGAAAGLTWDMGTRQTFIAMIIESAFSYGHRNVFKHEWGHSILSYFDALGVAPKPSVINHATADDYVNCKTGQQYIWVDETDADPIPNSIYNNESGFTHDYYSGTVATADQPTRCLGITPEAWAYGGPVSDAASIQIPFKSFDVTKLNVFKWSKVVELSAKFKLDESSVGGINPGTGLFELKIADKSFTVPLNAFTTTFNGVLKYSGKITNNQVSILMTPSGKKSYRLDVSISGNDLIKIKDGDKVSVSLAIGENRGMDLVKAHIK